MHSSARTRGLTGQTVGSLLGGTVWTAAREGRAAVEGGMKKFLFSKNRKRKSASKSPSKPRAKKAKVDRYQAAFWLNKHSAPSNSGVFRSAGIDWLTLSMPQAGEKWRETLREVARTFVINTDEEATSGHGYRGYGLAGFGSLTWRGTDIKVDLPGQAMQYVREHLKILDDDICRWFIQRGFRFTRIDLALDTDHAAFNPLIAFRALKADDFSCDCGTFDFKLDKMVRGKQIFPRHGRGMTTYIGAPKSIRRVRIYDRKAKLAKWGELPTDEFGQEIERATRIELQGRKEAADLYAIELARLGPGIIPPLIGSFLTFLDANDKRSRRVKRVAPYWSDIIGPVTKALPRLRSPTPTEKTKLWLDKQVAPSLKMLKVYDPERYERLLQEKVALAEVTPAKRKKWEACEAERLRRKEEIAELLQEEQTQEYLARLELDRRRAIVASAQKPDETK